MQDLLLPGFAPNENYYITWFPTHMNSDPTDLPTDFIDTENDGQVLLNLSSRPFGGVLNNYLDTLHSDYAFVITPEPYVKSLRLSEAPTPIVGSDWNFSMYPNPSRDVIQLVLPDDADMILTIFDMQGRTVLQRTALQGVRHHIAVDRLAPGAYSVLLTNGSNSKLKKLIIY